MSYSQGELACKPVSESFCSGSIPLYLYIGRMFFLRRSPHFILPSFLLLSILIITAVVGVSS